MVAPWDPVRLLRLESGICFGVVRKREGTSGTSVKRLSSSSCTGKRITGGVCAHKICARRICGVVGWCLERGNLSAVVVHHPEDTSAVRAPLKPAKKVSPRGARIAARAYTALLLPQRRSASQPLPRTQRGLWQVRRADGPGRQAQTMPRTPRSRARGARAASTSVFSSRCSQGAARLPQRCLAACTGANCLGHAAA